MIERPRPMIPPSLGALYRDHAEEINPLLDCLAREYLHAKYLHGNNFEHMRRWVMGGLPTGVHYGRGVEKLILQCLGHVIGAHSLKRDLHCDLATVERYRAIARERMDALNAHAMKAVRAVCEGRGWV